MFKLQSKISVSLKVVLALTVAIALHIVAAPLRALPIISDVFIVLGAYYVYELVTDEDVRYSFTDNFLDNDFDVDGFSEWLLLSIHNILEVFGYGYLLPIEEKEEEPGTEFIIELTDTEPKSEDTLF